MSNQIKIRHISWRDGRPRFNPGKPLRQLGYGGRDLRHEGGEWFTPDQAREFSMKIADDVAAKRKAWEEGTGRSIPTAIRRLKLGRPGLPNRSGYIYFLKSGQHIKIGFSTNPWSRGAALATALSHGVNSMAIVQGTQREERRLHTCLQRYRQHGEWFDCHPELMEVLMECLALGRVAVEANVEGPKTEPKSRSLRLLRQRKSVWLKKKKQNQPVMVGAPGLEPGTR